MVYPGSGSYFPGIFKALSRKHVCIGDELNHFKEKMCRNCTDFIIFMSEQVVSGAKTITPEPGKIIPDPTGSSTLVKMIGYYLPVLSGIHMNLLHSNEIFLTLYYKYIRVWNG
jgi:hypothetical protein